MGAIESIKTWLISIAIKKGLSRVIQVGVAAVAVWLGAHGADLKKYGVDVNLDTTAAIAAAVGGLEVLRNWLKVKKGVTWL